jgi:hypothetical protein
MSRDTEEIAKRRDAWYTVAVVDRIAIPLTLRLACTPVTPNQVTIAALAIRAVALALIVAGHVWWAFVIWQVAFVLDCVDGKLARLTRRFSPYGKALDQWGDLLMAFLFLVVAGATVPGLAVPVMAAMFIWFLLWSSNWLVSDRVGTPVSSRGPESRARSGGVIREFIAWYDGWTGRHRLKRFPVTGVEEAVLLMPLALATGTLPVVAPMLAALRLLALGRQASRRLRGAVPRGSEPRKGVASPATL